MYNKVVLVGNVTRDPELRYTGNGTPVTTLGVAMNRVVNDTERTTYVDVDVWAKQAENVCEYITKGRQVLIDGRLEYDTWEDDDGNKRSKLKVVAEEVKFLGKKGD